MSIQKLLVWLDHGSNMRGLDSNLRGLNSNLQCLDCPISQNGRRTLCSFDHPVWFKLAHWPALYLFEERPLVAKTHNPQLVSVECTRRQHRVHFTSKYSCHYMQDIFIMKTSEWSDQSVLGEGSTLCLHTSTATQAALPEHIQNIIGQISNVFCC